MSLTSKENVKLLLGISGTDQDTLLDYLIAEADVIIEGYLGRRIEQETFTEYYSGTGDDRLWLHNTPVASITSIHQDNGGYFGQGSDAFAAATLLTEGSDYVLERDDASETEPSASGCVFRIGGIWNRPQVRRRGQLCSEPGSGKGNIKVVYVGGFAVVPKDLEFCANRLVVQLYKFRKKPSGISSESFEDYSYSLAGSEDADKALDSSKSVLARYRRIII